MHVRSENSGAVSNKLETANSLPTQEEHDRMYLTGWAAGCVVNEKKFPTHEGVQPPVGSNGKSVVGLSSGDAAGMASLLCALVDGVGTIDENLLRHKDIYTCC